MRCVHACMRAKKKNKKGLTKDEKEKRGRGRGKKIYD